MICIVWCETLQNNVNATSTICSSGKTKTNLNKFIDKHKLLTDSQYGFRINRSTSPAIIDSTEEITNSIDH